MKILAIETSCDDTAIAILEVRGKKRTDFNILSNIVSSQVEIHKKYGGVYPTLAKREHQRNLVPVLEKALKQSRLLKKSKLKSQNVKPQLKTKNLEKILERENYLCRKLEKFFKKYQKPKVNLIAVTVGPGLEPCLWVGVNFAKALSYFWNIPVVAVNHIEAHILVNWLSSINEISNFQFPISKQIPNSKFQIPKIKFPAVCLIVSGGHTQLILMEDIGNYKIIGETRDDAAGECFDKVAKILGLEYPGGPAIAEQARQWPSETDRDPFSISLPRPMINSKDYDFSFSGLKTAVLYNFKKQPVKVRKSKQYIQEMCAETQQAIIDVLIKKTLKAAKDYRAKTIILGGGVAANKELRRQFIENCKLKIENCNFLAPAKNLCTDNAVMTAVAGYYGKTKPWQKIEAKANLRIG